MSAVTTPTLSINTPISKILTSNATAITTSSPLNTPNLTTI